MNKVLLLFKSRFFRIIFAVFFVIGGILAFQKYQDLQNPTCKDCNLILISVDTLRPDHMGVYGYEKNTTPNIDKWAKGATVLTNMHTVVPATFPSFTTLMTGKHVFDTQIYNNFGVRFDGKLLNGGEPIDSNTQTIADILSANGYITAAFITNQSLNTKLTNIGKGFKQYNHFIGDWNKNKYLEFFNKSLDWMQQNKNKKLFLWLHLMSPHSPYSPTNDFQCKFNNKYCNVIKTEGLTSLEDERKKYQGCFGNIDKNTLELYKTLYDGEIGFDDNIVGEILNTIKDTGLDKKTVVILLSDHGEGFEHDYYFMHTDSLNEQHTRIPFIIKMPNLNGGMNNTLIDNTQFFATILELLGISKGSNSSFIQVLRNHDSNSINNRPVYSVNTNLSKFSITLGDYKYIYSIQGYTCQFNNKDEFLYNLKDDPNEEINLEDTNIALKNIYKQMLMTHLEKYNLPTIPINWYIEDTHSEEKEAIIQDIKSLGY